MDHDVGMTRGARVAVLSTLATVGAGIAILVAIAGPASVQAGPEALANLASIFPLALGWILVVRAPSSPVGPILTVLAAALIVIPALDTWGYTAFSDSPWWGSSLVAVVSPALWAWQIVPFLALLVIFPSGLLPGILWRVVASLIPVSAASITVALLVESWAASDALVLPALVMLLSVAIACLGSVIVRYQVGDEKEKRQLGWLILASLCVVVLMAASWVGVSFNLVDSAAFGVFLLSLVVLVPTAVTIAVLRHDLFEIERLLGDVVAWIATTLAAAALVAALVLGLGALLGSYTPAGLAVAVFVAAVALLPLHHRIHRAVGGVIDRDRTTVRERMARFVERVREGSAEPEEVEAALADAVGDDALRVYLTDPAGAGTVNTRGEAEDVPESGVRIPLTSAGLTIAVVVVGEGSSRRVRRARLALEASSLAVDVSRLNLGLRRALADVEESRRRVWTAAVHERTRIERDLHDGAQQQLVAVGMKLRAAQRQVDPSSSASADIDKAVEMLERTVGDLRELAHGVRPPRLEDGLDAALRDLVAGSPIPVDVRVDAAVVSDVITTTAYFVVSEAMANVLKHARATRVGIHVRRERDELHVRVTDDGVGGVPATFALTALRDRVASIGGSAEATSSPGRGTTITAVLPCGS